MQNATLTRFYSLHFVLPMLIGGVACFHLVMLHETGRNNPLGLGKYDKIPFHTYFTLKDMIGFVVAFCVLICLAFFYPYRLGEPDNFIVANPINTPTHIVPE